MTYEEAIAKLRDIMTWDVDQDTAGDHEEFPELNSMEVGNLAIDVLEELVARMRSLEK